MTCWLAGRGPGRPGAALAGAGPRRAGRAGRGERGGQVHAAGRAARLRPARRRDGPGGRCGPRRRRPRAVARPDRLGAATRCAAARQRRRQRRARRARCLRRRGSRRVGAGRGRGHRPAADARRGRRRAFGRGTAARRAGHGHSCGPSGAPGCSCSTSPPPTSTARPGTACSPVCAGSRPAAACCWSCTTAALAAAADRVVRMNPRRCRSSGRARRHGTSQALRWRWRRDPARTCRRHGAPAARLRRPRPRPLRRGVARSACWPSSAWSS